METSDIPTVTLSEAKTLISCLAHRQSILLLSAPGVGKSDAVRQAADEAGLECKSLLGTQIAPEDVSGIPRIVGERSVFCPPRILLPEDPKPFCLFLDELPACSPDIQKAFYSLLLERRLGEHKLPEGTWVVAAGNRAEDRSLVRTLSAALVNRVLILQVKVDVHEWVAWAYKAGIRKDIISYILFNPMALQREIPSLPLPFSTPRAWASLAQSLDMVDAQGKLNQKLLETMAYGCVSAEDAGMYAAFVNFRTDNRVIMKVMNNIKELPSRDDDTTAVERNAILQSIHNLVSSGLMDKDFMEVDGVKIQTCFTQENVCNLLVALNPEERVMMLLGCVDTWGKLGADDIILEEYKKLVGALL